MHISSLFLVEMLKSCRPFRLLLVRGPVRCLENQMMLGSSMSSVSNCVQLYTHLIAWPLAALYPYAFCFSFFFFFFFLPPCFEGSSINRAWQHLHVRYAPSKLNRFTDGSSIIADPPLTDTNLLIPAPENTKKTLTVPFHVNRR